MLVALEEFVTWICTFMDGGVFDMPVTVVNCATFLWNSLEANSSPHCRTKSERKRTTEKISNSKGNWGQNVEHGERVKEAGKDFSTIEFSNKHNRFSISAIKLNPDKRVELWVGNERELKVSQSWIIQGVKAVSSRSGIAGRSRRKQNEWIKPNRKSI